MQQRQLTPDGTQVSVIGLGTWPFGGGMGSMDDQTVMSVTRSAIDSGINLIDTAQAYSLSEQRLGKALKDGYRDRCFLATKVIDDYSPEGIKAAMEQSLRMLDVDHVDLYQIHRPSSDAAIDETLRALDDLVRAGKVRYIGTSTFAAWQVVESLWASKEYGLNRFVSEQPPYHLLDRRAERELHPWR